MKSKFIITFIFFALAAFGAKAETAVRDTVPVTKRGITPPRNLQNYDPSQAAGKFGQVMGVKRYSGTAGDTMVGYLPFYVLSASEAYLGTDRLVTAGNISSYAPATDLGYTAATRVLTSSTGTDVTLPLSSSTAPGLLPTLGTSLQLARVNSAGTSLEYFTPSYLTAVTGTARFSGSGTSGSPLELAQQSAATGQGLGWNGAYWAPWTFFHTASSRFSGAGTAASPLEIAQQGATTGNVLTWNGTTWAPAASVSVTDGNKGDIVVSGSGTTWSINALAVTGAKIAANAIDSTKAAGLSITDLRSASGKLFGRASSGVGSGELITVGAGLSLSAGGTLTATGTLGGTGTGDTYAVWTSPTVLAAGSLYRHATNTNWFGFGASPVLKFDYPGVNVHLGADKGTSVGGNLYEAATRTANTEKLTRMVMPTYAQNSVGNLGLILGYATATGSSIYFGGNAGFGCAAPDKAIFAINGTSFDGMRLSSTGLKILPTGSGSFASEALDVAGNILATGVAKLSDGTAAAPAYSFSADLNTGLFRPTDDVIGFSTGGTERVRVSATGKVGVGTTSPTNVLDVSGTATDGGAVMKVTGSLIAAPVTQNDGVVFNITGAGSSGASTPRALAVNMLAGYTGSSNTLALQFNNQSAGTNYNLGCSGVASGTAKNIGLTGFAANGTTNIGGYFALQNGPAGAGTQSAALIADNAGGTSNPIFLGHANSSEVFRIGSTGNVGIANTSPSEKLHVTGNIRFSGALMPNNAPGTAGQVLTSAGAGAPPTWGSAGTIGGTAAANRVAYGDGSNSLTSTANFTYTSGVLEAARSAGASIRVAYSAGSVYTDIGTNSSGYGYLSPTGKRLGVNTTAPSATIHAQNDGTGTQKAVILDHSSGTMSTGNELQLDLALGGTAMARVSAVKESTGYGLKFYTGGSAAVNATPVISATGSNSITVGDATSAAVEITGNDIAIGGNADDITISSTGAGASTNFQGGIGLDDYVEETANSGTLAAKSWHYIDPTGAATRTLPGSMNDGTWLFVVNQDGTFDITISAPGGETLTGSATITAGKTGMFHKSGTVWYRITF